MDHYLPDAAPAASALPEQTTTPEETPAPESPADIGKAKPGKGKAPGMLTDNQSLENGFNSIYLSSFGKNLNIIPVGSPEKKSDYAFMCREVIDPFTEPETVTERIYYFRDEAGRILHADWDDVEIESCTYDETARLLTHRKYDLIYEFSYDDAGRTAVIAESHGETGQEIGTYTYTYGETDGTYKIAYFSFADNAVIEEYRYENGKKVSERTRHGAQYTYEYDENGNLVVRYCTEQDGTTWAEYRFYYDETGVLLRADTCRDTSSFVDIMFYIYDETGNCIFIEEYDNKEAETFDYLTEQPSARSEFTYDEKGNLKKERRYLWNYDEAHYESADSYVDYFYTDA